MKIVNNACKKCEFFDEKKKICSIKEGSPIRKCVIGINKQLLREFNEVSKTRKIKVLEIGCGIWSPIKDGVIDNVEWRGIDVVTEINGKPVIATEIASVEKMPYQNDYFDYAFANQSAEHWFEYGVNFDKALAEISRVLKKEGVLHLNMPIHLHGDNMFIFGRVDEFLKRFNSSYWEISQVEEWRKDCSPQVPFKPWEKDDFLKHMLGNNLPTGAWVLNVKVKKKKTHLLTTKSRILNLANKAELKLFPRKIRMAKHYGIFNTTSLLASRLRRKLLK